VELLEAAQKRFATKAESKQGISIPAEAKAACFALLEPISKSPEEDKEAGRVERSQGSSLDDIPIGRGSGAAKVATQTWDERVAKLAANKNIPTHIAMQRARRLYPEVYQQFQQSAVYIQKSTKPCSATSRSHRNT
jgi:hypothetical protein